MNKINPQSWKKEMPEFRRQTEAFYAGTLKQSEYKGFSGLYGSYAQRGGQASMLRLAYDGRPCDEGEAGICGRNDPEVSGKTCAFYNVRDDPAA